MTGGASISIQLTLDCTGTSQFRELGFMQAPVPDFAAALVAFLADFEPEQRDFALNRAASLAAGVCVLNNLQSAAILNRCFEMRLAADWRLYIPGAGIIQGLFVIGSFNEAEDAPGRYSLALMLAGKPSFQAAEPEGLEAG